MRGWTITCVKYHWYCSIFGGVMRNNWRVRFFWDTMYKQTYSTVKLHDPRQIGRGNMLIFFYWRSWLYGKFNSCSPVPTPAVQTRDAWPVLLASKSFTELVWTTNRRSIENWTKGSKPGENRRFAQSIIRARLQDDSCRMIRAITGMIRALMLLIWASKLLCCLIYFFQTEIKLPYLPYLSASYVDIVYWFC